MGSIPYVGANFLKTKAMKITIENRLKRTSPEVLELYVTTLNTLTDYTTVMECVKACKDLSEVFPNFNSNLQWIYSDGILKVHQVVEKKVLTSPLFSCF